MDIESLWEKVWALLIKKHLLSFFVFDKIAGMDIIFPFYPIFFIFVS